jgi:hypothetical protein
MEWFGILGKNGRGGRGGDFCEADNAIGRETLVSKPSVWRWTADDRGLWGGRLYDRFVWLTVAWVVEMKGTCFWAVCQSK